jgi:hypothetical protein
MQAMSKKNQNGQLELYNSAKDRQEWKNHVYLVIVNKINSFDRKFSRYRWNMMLAYYHVDLLNFPEEKDDIYAGLIAFTCVKTGLSTEEVERIFSLADSKLSKEVDVAPQLFAKDTDSAYAKLVTCGTVSYEISTESWKAFNSNPHFKDTFLRYSFLNPESGLFWSIPTELYDIVSNVKYGIGVLECFASPFNYNLKAFCSAFPSDLRLDYPKGVTCYGDFFAYIQDLKTHKDPVRLIVNPPYTERMIDRTAEELSSYMQQHSDGEFIAMLPDWIPQKGIQTLVEMKGSVSRYFASREFYLYDAIHQKTIKPVGMKILIIVNLGGDVEESRELLDELTETIERVSARLQ